jgi:hypothetical protein
MRLRSTFILALAAIMLISTVAHADQIVLKDGRVYSGRFLRGDSNSVEFQILGKNETFSIADVARIEFKQPGLGVEAPVREQAVANPRSLPSAQPVQPPVTGDLTPQAPPVREVPPQIPAGDTITLPSGTTLVVRTLTAIDTDRNRIGDPFEAALDEPIVIADQIVVPRDSKVKGVISHAQESGKLSGQSQLMLELTELNTNGKSYYLRTSDYRETGSQRADQTAKTVGGTAVVGAVIGAIAGGGKGAAIGAASGAAVGVGVQVVTRGEVLKIPAETALEFRLQSPLTIDRP